MKETNTRILVIAGEPSGDRHAAELVTSLQKIRPDISFWGIGGDEMAARQVTLLYRIEQMSFLGLTEIIRHIPFIRQVFRHLLRWVKENQPRAVILVDYPGFNLRLAKAIHKLNIPVIYYISPQLWAWGLNRVKKIRKYVNLMLVIFRFEEEFYGRHSISATFVGHPLVDEVKLKYSDKDFRKNYNFHPRKPIVGLLPGSRVNEVKLLLPEMLKTIDLMENKNEIEWVVGKSVNVPAHVYDSMLRNYTDVRLIDRDIYHLMKFSNVVLVASGTATLETGYLGTPMVVLYKISPLTYHIGKHLVRIKNIALANIVLQESVVPELIQNQVTPENIRKELQRYFNDIEYFRQVSEKLERIARILGEPGASRRAAQALVVFLDKTSNG
jgi:lipid-A-disaccharide synthase